MCCACNITENELEEILKISFPKQILSQMQFFDSENPEQIIYECEQCLYLIAQKTRRLNAKMVTKVSCKLFKETLSHCKAERLGHMMSGAIRYIRRRRGSKQSMSKPVARVSEAMLLVTGDTPNSVPEPTVIPESPSPQKTPKHQDTLKQLSSLYDISPADHVCVTPVKSAVVDLLSSSPSSSAASDSPLKEVFFRSNQFNPIICKIIM